MNTKILYFIDNLQNTKSGIFTTLVQTVKFSKNLENKNTIIGGTNGSNNKDYWDKNSVEFKILGFKSLNLLYGLNKWLKLNINQYDLVSIHTFWSYSNKFIYTNCIKYNIPFIITIHGVLNTEALKISNWKKKIALFFFLNNTIKHAKCIQALNLTEYNVIRNLGIKTPIAIIENGISLPDYIITRNVNKELINTYSGKKTVLYLGRLHPIKGVDRLIHSWMNVNKSNEWQLIIAGDGDIKYVKSLKRIVLNYKDDSIKFIGHIEGDDKDFCFKNCDFTVLPSLSEAFSMSVLESLSYSKPALITSTCNFEEATLTNSAIEVDSSIDGIKDGLILMFSKSKTDLELMGMNGLNLIKERYIWPKIYEKIDQLYSWIKNKDTSVPSFVKLD